MACFENPDGTITCTDGLTTLVAAIGANWPTKTADLKTVGPKLQQHAAEHNLTRTYAILVNADEVDRILGRTSTPS